MTTLSRLRSAALVTAAGLSLSACAQMGSGSFNWPWQEPRSTVPAPRPAETIQVPEPRPAKAAAPRPAAKPADKKAVAKPGAPEPEAAREGKETARLVGLSEAETTELLGRPAEEIEQPPGKVWTYKAAGCRLSVHLFPDMDKGGFYTLDYTAEEGSREACLGKLAADARKKE